MDDPALSIREVERPALSALKEDPALSILEEKTSPSRTQEEDTTRLSPSSEETVLDASLSAPINELASSSAQQEQRATTTWVVMSKGKETSTVMTLLGDVPPKVVQQGTHDSISSFHKDNRDEHETEVNYNSDSSEELDGSALRIEKTTPGLCDEQLTLEQPALRGPLAMDQEALSVEPTTALDKEPSSRHEKGAEEGPDSS